MKGIVYKGVRIMPGSESWELLQAWKAGGGQKARDKLDKHLKELDRKLEKYLEEH
ncbi:hypothetical protein Amme3_00138 [Pseudomonas phage vB_PpuM-Amme-3]|uniref:Uncharacterized protein n=1 Tax=Pseudomonas phage vB_PpuM-Amme-3 TaxID=3132617 RepID=A0AAX4MXJ3_9CAUD